MGFDVAKYSKFLGEVHSFETNCQRISSIGDSEREQLDLQLASLRGKLTALQEELKRALEQAGEKAPEQMYLLLSDLDEADSTLVRVSEKIAELSFDLGYLSSSPSSSESSSSRIYTKTPSPPPSKSKSVSSSPEFPGMSKATLVPKIYDLAETVESFRGRFQDWARKPPLTPTVFKQHEATLKRLQAELVERKAAFARLVGDGELELVKEMLFTAEKTLEFISENLERLRHGERIDKLSKRGILALGPDTDPWIAGTKLIERPWVYNPSGGPESATPKEKRNYLHQAVERRPSNLDKFYEKTRAVCDPFGDGCCGYYCVGALLSWKAIEYPGFKQQMIAKFQELSKDWQGEITFTDGNKVRKIDKKQLAIEAIEFLNSMDRNTFITNAFTKENGQVLNLFFRTAVREAVAQNQLDEGLTIALTIPDNGNPALIESLNKQYSDIEEPVVIALEQLLGVNIGVINFDDRSNALFIPDERGGKPFDGYLVRTNQAGGHYLVSFARD